MSYWVVDVSIERVAALAQENTLPVPILNLGSMAAGSSGFGQYQPVVHAPVPTRAYTSDDPWTIPKYTTSTINGATSAVNGAPSSIAGTGLPKDWWKKQQTVHVSILGQQGFLLNRYLVYEVSSNVSESHLATILSETHDCVLSEEHQYPGVTPNLCFYGTVWSNATPSDCFQHFLRNE